MPSGVLGQIKPFEVPSPPKLAIGGGQAVVVLEVHPYQVETPPLATPRELLLGALGNPLLRLKKPLKVVVEREDGYFVVSSDELEEFGYGEHFALAIWDFQKTVSGLYFSLKEEQERLGPDLMRLWSRIGEYIEER